MKKFKVDPFSSPFIHCTLLFLLLLLLTCFANGHHEPHHHGHGHDHGAGGERNQGNSGGGTSAACGGQTSATAKGASRHPPLLKLSTIGNLGRPPPFHYSSQDKDKDTKSHGYGYEQSTVLRLNSSSAEVTIECEAPFPIDLTFHGHLTNREFKVDIKRTTTPGNTSCFLITARSPTSERITGNFSCFSVDEPQVGSSFYVYVTPSFPGYLLLRGQEFKVKVGLTQENVTLPCPSSNYLAEVQLWKKDEGNNDQERSSTEAGAGEWSKIEPSKTGKTVRYDPKIGWILRVHSGVFGVYQCTSNGQDNVTITVEDDGYQVSPAVVNVPLSVNESFAATCAAREEVQLEFHKTQFQLKENISMTLKPGSLDKNAEGTVKSYSIGIKSEPLKENQINGSVTCKRKINGTNQEIHRWNLVKSERVQSLRSFLSECGRNVDAIKVFDCSNWIECRMRRCQEYDQNCWTNEFCVDDDKSPTVGNGKCPKNVIYQCIPPYYSSSPSMMMVIYFAGLKTKQLTDWRTVTQDEILDLESKPKSDAVTFACHGSAFVFTRFFQWTVKYRGKSQKSADTIQHIPNENVTHMFSRSSVGIITSEIHLDNPRNVKEVSCTAPLWNSTDTKTITKSYTHSSSSSLNTSEWMVILLYLLNYLFCL